MPNNDGYIPMQEAVKRYGKVYTTFLHHVQRGNIKGKKVGVHWYISPDSIEEYYDEERDGIKWSESVARALVPIIEDGINFFVQRFKGPTGNTYIELFLPNDSTWSYKLTRYRLPQHGFAFSKSRSDEEELCFRREL